MYRIYATFGTHDNPTPRWIYVYTDERVATDAPNDAEYEALIAAKMAEQVS